MFLAWQFTHPMYYDIRDSGICVTGKQKGDYLGEERGVVRDKEEEYRGQWGLIKIP